jgi:hypothetical protein
MLTAGLYAMFPQQEVLEPFVCKLEPQQMLKLIRVYCRGYYFQSN